MRSYFFVFIISILALIGCQQKEASYINISNKEKIDSVLNVFVDQSIYPFLYARIEDKNGKVVYEYSTKNNKLLKDYNIDGDSWIRIWSMSKIVTICLTLDLIEDGVIKMEDPVSKYIPEFKNLKVAVKPDSSCLLQREFSDTICPLTYVDNDSVMTIRHLFDHKAGFYYALTGVKCLDSMIAKQNFPTSKNSQELINRMASLPLIQHSGTQYFYGTNTTVLGLVAERASGKTLAELVKDRITDPMQISGLQYDLPKEAKMLPRISGKDSILREAHQGELDIFGDNVPSYDPNQQLYLGGEGMIATANGYCDFLRMLLNKGTLNGYRFLEEATIEDLQSPHTLIDNPYGHNGYNLWVSGDSMRLKGQGDSGLWIGGGYEGTHFWIDPKRKFVATLMTQMFAVYSPVGYSKDNRFRGEVYRPWTNINYKD